MLFKKIVPLVILALFYRNFSAAQTAYIGDNDTLTIERESKYNTLNYKDGKFGLRNEDVTSGKRFWRSQLLVGGTEVLGMGILMALPKRITKWDDDYIKKAKQNLRESWTMPPVWDKDDFAMNYIAHPLVGSYYYNAMRSQGSKKWSAFLFSTAQSFLWEYCIEGVAERPSTQDLLFTSTTGALLGEAIHRTTLRMGRNGFTTFEKIAVTIMNPLFLLNNKYSYRLNQHSAGTVYSRHK
ncbi:MAG TPA: DUF3943 domain-containing protein [Sphingobacteriaceae bacterium]|nr:DUF3943 domain-containing protein [Sphingobacteriaceae bacterium]